MSFYSVRIESMLNKIKVHHLNSYQGANIKKNDNLILITC